MRLDMVLTTEGLERGSIPTEDDLALDTDLMIETVFLLLSCALLLLLLVELLSSSTTSLVECRRSAVMDASLLALLADFRSETLPPSVPSPPLLRLNDNNDNPNRPT
jgi:hypothetical protein